MTLHHYVTRRFLACIAAALVSICTSTAQLTWVQRLSGTSTSINAVGYNGAHFLASTPNLTLTSPDGVSWTTHSWGGASVALTYANANWIGVGSSGGIYTSPGNSTWTSRRNIDFQGFTDVAYGDGTLVAVGWSGKIERSIDNGATWQLAASPTSQPIYGIAFGGGIFLAITQNQEVLRSSDGLIWALSNINDGSGVGRVEYGGGRFVSVGNYTVTRSIDGGNSWSSSDFFPNFSGPKRIRFGNGIFVVVGRGGEIKLSHDGGVSWENSSSGVTVDLNDVTYGEGKWVAVGENGVVLTASDSAAIQLVPTVAVSAAVCLEWQTQAGAIYQVQFSDDFQSWQNVGPSLTGDGNTKRYCESQNGQKRFYRVQIK